MKIICPSCNASYNIPSQKIPEGKKANATCKKCGNMFEISSASGGQTVHSAPVSEQVVTSGTSVEPVSLPGLPENTIPEPSGHNIPEPDHSEIDQAIFTVYPDLQDFPIGKFDLKEILNENKKGGYKSRKNRFKVKILKAVAEILPNILGEDESVVRIAKGTASYPLEILFGNGFLTMMYNHYAIICTTKRLLFINIDHKMKKSTHYLYQMIYHEIKKIKRSLFGSIIFQRKNNKKRVFNGIKRAFSKEIREYVTEKMSAPRPQDLSSSPEIRLDQYNENLCPSCFTDLEKGLIECSSCKVAFKKPKKAFIRSLILPGLGDIYLGHRTLGALELVGSFIVWIIVISLILEPEESGLAVPILLLVFYNGLDGLLTFHMGKKGYMLAEKR